MVAFRSKRGRGRTLEKKGQGIMRASDEEREVDARERRTRVVRWHKKRRSKREEKRGTGVVKGNRGEDGMRREMRKKAVEEKERERKRDGVEAAGFLSRHRRSHPTKIDSVSLDSSVQRRATPRTFCPRPVRERRQRVSSVLVILFLLTVLSRFSLKSRIL